MGNVVAITSKLVDEYGELERFFSHPETAVKLKRFRALKDTFREILAEHPADQPAVLEGNVYVVKASEREFERVFPLKAKTQIFTKLGKKRAMELFTITLKAVRQALGEDAIDEFAICEQTGSRELVAVLRNPAETRAA